VAGGVLTRSSLEHLPTYTTGRRDSSPNPDTLHPEEKKVQNVGAEFHITKRGGQVTYHGPGQLVGYPILDLNNLNVSVQAGHLTRSWADAAVSSCIIGLYTLLCRICARGTCLLCKGYFWYPRACTTSRWTCWRFRESNREGALVP
jgi:hypothetical protein